MTRMRLLAAALCACGVLTTTGCQTDDAVKKDAGNAAQDAKHGAKKGANEVDKAVDDATN